MRGCALAQRRDEALLRHRLPEQEALTEVAAHAHQGNRIRGLFDARGDCDTSENVREIDRRLAERRVDLIGAAVGDKSAIELELGKGQFAELRQRLVAAVEIVDASRTSERSSRLVSSPASARSVTICSSGTSVPNLLIMGFVNPRSRPRKAR